jgi:hypothetical protein
VDNIPGFEVVPIGWCVEAMGRSFERVRSTGWNDAVGAYAAIAETLFWVDIVDDQLRTRYQPDYEAALREQHEDVASVLAGLRFARNRITHEVDEVGYVFATAKEPDGFAAAWTWRSLPPRPGQRQAVLHNDYERAIAGRDVVKTLLIVTVFLRGVRNRMWQNYGKNEPDSRA